MKHISVLIATIIIGCMQCMAQTADIKNAHKSVLKLTTYKADGSVLAESNCVLTDNNGTAISSLEPFIGAAKATVTDHKGHNADVSRMLGTDELYDMAKFKIDGIKAEPLAIAATPAKAGDTTWLITYNGDGKQPVKTTVKNVETFMDKYAYYIFKFQAPSQSASCPFVNENGQIIGLMKLSATSTDIHAIDANYIMGLTTTGFALSDPTLRQIGIPPALPQKQSDAQLMLIMAEQNGDSIKHPAIAHDFIAKYPTLIDGYSSLARFQVNNNNFDGAAETMTSAIKQVGKKDEAHASYGKIIYDKLTYKANMPYEAWTLDKAAEETNKALSLNPLPTYRHQQAQITFAQGNYQQAYDTFIQLMETPMRAPELFYEAAQCKMMMKAPQKEIIALLDSAINNTDSLHIRDAAPYFLARAEAYNAADSFRLAVFDYTRYEILAGQRLGANFYYIRSQVEIKAKLYQQALADMATAIMRAPQEPTYYAEMASLQLRVNLFDDAIGTANRCIKLAPDYSDGYLLLGLAQIQKGDKSPGLANLEKAKQLGNPQAQQFIDKYSK